jgi:hypothetical protein
MVTAAKSTTANGTVANSQEIGSLGEYMNSMTYAHAEERLNVVIAVGEEHEIVKCVIDWVKVLLQVMPRYISLLL